MVAVGIRTHILTPSEHKSARPWYSSPCSAYRKILRLQPIDLCALQGSVSAEFCGKQCHKIGPRRLQLDVSISNIMLWSS